LENSIEKIRNIFICDDFASLQNQIIDLVFRDCFYRTHNYGLKLEIQCSKVKPSFFLQYYHNDYFLSQAVRFRKILEKNNDVKSRKTYSIPSVISEIKKNCSNISFKNYLSMSYNLGPNQTPQQWVKDAIEKSRTNKFKLLSGGNTLLPSTLINLDYLDAIEKKINNDKKRLDYHLNKYWLHSSDPISRKPSDEEPKLLSLSYLQNLLKTTVWAAKTLSKYVDVHILSDMPTITYDPLIGSEIVFSERTKKHAIKYMHKRYEYYNKISAKYDDDEKLYLSTNKYVTIA
jgi:hypothetical protein